MHAKLFKVMTVAKKKTLSRGVSLLEVLIAVFILLTVLIMSMGFWVSCARFMAKTRARILGTYAAEQAMENVIALGYDGVSAMAGPHAYQLDVTMSGQPEIYTVNYEVTMTDVDEDLKSVQIKVKWDEVGGEATYETLLSATL